MSTETIQVLDWAETKRSILAQLDIAAEFQALGVTFTGSEANAKGWRTCRAFGREDKNPSAAVNVRTGF